MAEIACEQAALKTSPCERNEWFTRLLMLFIGAVSHQITIRRLPVRLGCPDRHGRRGGGGAPGAPRRRRRLVEPLRRPARQRGGGARLRLWRHGPVLRPPRRVVARRHGGHRRRGERGPLAQRRARLRLRRPRPALRDGRRPRPRARRLRRDGPRARGAPGGTRRDAPFAPSHRRSTLRTEVAPRAVESSTNVDRARGARRPVGTGGRFRRRRRARARPRPPRAGSPWATARPGSTRRRCSTTSRTSRSTRGAPGGKQQ